MFPDGAEQFEGRINEEVEVTLQVFRSVAATLEESLTAMGCESEELGA